MKISVCGIACEKCPRMTAKTCPNGEQGCTPKENPMCAIATCAHHKGMALCFECPEFPCDVTKAGPLSFGYCTFISGKEL
jgi:hypothetical protein